MTNQEHQLITTWIHEQYTLNGKYPTHKQILAKMLEVANEVTYKDAIEYGLGSTFRSRLSDLRKELNIISYDKDVPTIYGTTATVKAHRLMEVA